MDASSRPFTSTPERSACWHIRSDRAFSGRSGRRPRDGDGPRQEARNEHGRDELPPAQARIGRAGRGDRGRSRSGTLVARAASSHGWTERDVAGDPDAEAASDWLRRHYLRSFVRRYERWFDRSADESLEWRDAAEFGDTELRLSSDTLRAFGGELLELLDPYRHPSPDDPDARRVAFYYHAFPIESPDSEGLGACRMTILDVRSARSRYLLLTGLRWLPVGFMIPIFALVLVSRGLTLTEIGLVFAAQGLVVLALELPTGGLSDALGRRPVLLVASVIAIVSMTIFAVADSVVVFLAAMVLQGVYRALDSGPLEAWFVDATLTADPRAEIEEGLSRGTAALSIAIAVGALASGGLVALHPIGGSDPLLLPILVALGLHGVHLLGVAVLMSEPPRPRHPEAVAASVRESRRSSARAWHSCGLRESCSPSSSSKRSGASRW